MKLSQLIEELKKLNEDDYNVSISIEPIINEYKNFDGTGARFIKYRREIIIEDRKEIVEEIKGAD